MIAKRFITKKWVFDPAALKRERKIHRILAGARDHVFNTAIIEYGIDMDLDSYAALQLLDQLSKMVAVEGDQAQAQAKAS